MVPPEEEPKPRGYSLKISGHPFKVNMKQFIFCQRGMRHWNYLSQRGGRSKVCEGRGR